MFTKEINDTIILHIPHAGLAFPIMDGFLVSAERVQQEVELLTDHHTDILFNVPEITKLVCPWNRVFCDVERHADDADEPMAAKGMGFAYTHADDGTLIREVDEHLRLQLLSYYNAHHQVLDSLVRQKISEHGSCVIIDCHSFSSKPFQRDLDQRVPRPDICIGKTEQNTPQWLTDYLVSAWGDLTVAVDSPYSGSIVPNQFVGDNRVHSIMIEVNRDLYVNRVDAIRKEFVEPLFNHDSLI